MRDERSNLAVWEQPATVREYRSGSGFLDPGERAIHERVAMLLHGRPILDLGVGAGRTIPLLRPLTTRYVALDYAPSMVEACRRHHPEVDVQVGDARDLQRFDDGSFGLVTFSFNGIDVVDHEGRTRVMTEVRRVLSPGGLFWFSTLNMDGFGPKMRPWQPEWPQKQGRALVYATRVLHMLARTPKRVYNRTKLLPRFERGEGWCLASLSAHDYRLLMHYTSLRRQLDELKAHGFLADPVVLDCTTGRPVRADDEQSHVFWYQILATKPGGRERSAS